ncbi:acyltransferase [Salipiger sp. PrR002]|uniref:acyltransferase family protein n=1 Tax=Salipiger sp. PrR002 TaxID=2706489 RepID=UPI0013B7FF3F|nr:acyltransferase [Salipiger sp. PrR002]NDV99833.1 acyltransferase [Salipiger sp. PrR002]NDW56569.1 acyltransferase [Salipiger sp. PrR004]
MMISPGSIRPREAIIDPSQDSAHGTNSFGCDLSAQRLTTLQACRAIAAIAVVAFHAHAFFLPGWVKPGEIVSPAFDMGYAGVDFFFVLSGFLMWLLHRGDIGDRSAAGRFMQKRALRILPFYWCILSGLALLMLAGIGAEKVSPEQFLYALSLVPLPDGSPFLLEQAWTLSHEMLFYAFFALVIFAPRLGGLVFAFWQAAIVIALPFEFRAYPVDLLLAPHNLLFAFGICAAWGFRRLALIPAIGVLLVGIFGFIGVGLLEAYGVMAIPSALRTGLFGAFAALAIAGLAACESAGKLRAGRWMVFLGDASYAIYLVHGIGLALTARAMEVLGLGQGLTPGLALLVLVCGGVLAGVLAHLLVERPMLRALRRLQSPRQVGAERMAEG